MEGIAHGMKPRSAHAPSVAVAQKFVADSTGKKKPKKAMGGPLRLMGRQPSAAVAGRMLGRGQIGPIATADRTLRDAQQRLAGIPGMRRAVGPQPPRRLAT